MALECQSFKWKNNGEVGRIQGGQQADFQEASCLWRVCPKPRLSSALSFRIQSLSASASALRVKCTLAKFVRLMDKSKMPIYSTVRFGFFFSRFIYLLLFLFCAGSPLLHTGFLQLQSAGSRPVGSVVRAHGL